VWLLSWVLFRLNLRSVLHTMIVASPAANSLVQPFAPSEVDTLAEPETTDNKPRSTHPSGSG
jgi:hypothetical protein